MPLVIAMCAIHLRFYSKFTLKKKFKERRGRDSEKFRKSSLKKKFKQKRTHVFLLKRQL